MTVYRLEDKDGNGPFCYKDGIVKTNPKIKFDCSWLYAFDDLENFQELSYKEFLNNTDYILYKIELSQAITNAKSHEVKFFPQYIISKTKILRS